MPALTVPNGAQMTLRWLTGTENMYNVIGLYVNPGFVIDQSTANSLSAVVLAAWASSNISTYVDAGTSIATVGVRDLRTANLPEYFQSPGPNSGGDVGEKCPNSMALCVTHRTAKAGKSFRGRSYMPMNGAAAIDFETHLYVPGAATNAVKFWTDIKAGLVSSSQISGALQLAVLSRLDDATHTPHVTPIVSSMCRSQIATTQRRRLPKRG